MKKFLRSINYPELAALLTVCAVGCGILYAMCYILHIIFVAMGVA